MGGGHHVSNRFNQQIIIIKMIKVGDVVWAKIRGYPSWPAKVSIAALNRVTNIATRFRSKARQEKTDLRWNSLETRVIVKSVQRALNCTPTQRTKRKGR